MIDSINRLRFYDLVKIMKNKKIFEYLILGCIIILILLNFVDSNFKSQYKIGFILLYALIFLTIYLFRKKL